MTVTAFKANSEDTILTKFNDKTVDEAITILPSTLMKTPSLSFAIGYSAIFGVQRIIKISYTFTTTEIIITEFETLLKSNVGLHVVTFREVFTIPVGDFLDDEINSLYIAVEYILNDPQNMDYPLDNVSITSQKSTDTPPINAIKIMDVEISGGDIVNIVDNYNPDLESVNKGWVTDNYLSQTDATNTYLSQTDATNTYLSQTDASNTYLTSTDASSTYLTSTDASSTYLTSTDADNTYLSQTDASNTYLTSTDASSTYLTSTDASNTYLTSTDASNTYLTSTDADNDYLSLTDADKFNLEETTSIQDYNRLEWTDYKGVTSFIDKVHQEFMDIETTSLTSSESSNTSITFDSARLGTLNAVGSIDTGLIHLKGTFIGTRKSSWWDLGMFIHLYNYTIGNTLASDSTDRWEFTISFPLEELLRDRLGNNDILLIDSDNSDAVYQGNVSIQLMGFTRTNSSAVFVPDFIGGCWIEDGDLKVTAQADIMVDEASIREISGIAITAKLSGIGRI